MSKNLFDFTNEKIDSFEENDNLKFSQNQTNNIKDKIESYKNKSQEDLMNELYSSVNAQKNNGTFDMAKLENMVDTLSPYLSEGQKENIKGLLNKIR